MSQIRRIVRRFLRDQSGATEASTVLIAALIIIPIALLLLAFGKHGLDYLQSLGLNLFIGIALIALVAGGLNIFHRLMHGREGSAKVKSGKWLDLEFKVGNREEPEKPKVKKQPADKNPASKGGGSN